MSSIQTNLSFTSGIKHSSLQSSGKIINKKSQSNYSVNSEIIQFGFQIKTKTTLSLSDQNAIFHFNHLNKEDKSSLFYNDTPISELSVEKATELISEDGYFGINKTSQRISDFVINGAGDDIDRLRAGREGILKGFAEAEKAWGGKLPDISYETLAKSLDVIDKKLQEHGESVIDLVS